MISKRHIPFLKAVMLYSVTAFGGPSGHIGLIIKNFTEKRKDCTKDEILDYVSFCQLLPGASSTQVLSLIAYKRGGILLAFITLLIWIIPAMLFMLIFSILITQLGSNELNLSSLKYMQPMAIGFLAYAAYTAIITKINNTITIIIGIITALLSVLFFKSPWLFPALFIIAGITTSLSKKRFPVTEKPKKRKVYWFHLIVFLLLFLFAGILSETAKNKKWESRKELNLFENFYRFGSLVFGGGDVLIPLMLVQYDARPHNENLVARNPDIIKINSQELQTGAGLVRSVPGPVFSVAAYTGSLALKEQGIWGQIKGGLIATIAIFLPSVFLVFFFFPFWLNLKKYPIVLRALEGINAVVAGILLGTLIYLLKNYDLTNFSTYNIVSYLVIIGSFLYLMKSKYPAPLCVLICLILGFLF